MEVRIRSLRSWPSILHVPDMLPIYLHLLRRRRLEPPHRRHPRGFPLRPQPVRQDRVAARVATLPQLQPRHPGAPDPGSQPLIQLLLAGIQLARPPRPGGPQTGVPSGGRRYLRTVLRSKPVIEPIAWMQSPCRLSLPMLCKSFPLNRSRHLLSPRVDTGLNPPQGGDFSTGTMGIFAPALTSGHPHFQSRGNERFPEGV